MTAPVPSKDLITRLRDPNAQWTRGNPCYEDLRCEAADEIERLQLELAKPAHERSPPHCSTCACGLQRYDDKRDLPSIIAHLRHGDADGQDHDDAADAIERLQAREQEAFRLANAATYLVSPKYSLHAELKAFMDGQISQAWDDSATEPSSDQLSQAWNDVNALVAFAYEQGFHEIGYDPLNVIDSALAESRRDNARLEELLRLAEGLSVPGRVQIIEFVHWNEDPLIPYEGCNCPACADARTLVKTDTSDGTAKPPGDG